MYLNKQNDQLEIKKAVWAGLMEIGIDIMLDLVDRAGSVPLETKIAVLESQFYELKKQREEDRKEFYESTSAALISRKEMHAKIDRLNGFITDVEGKLSLQILSVEKTILAAFAKKENGVLTSILKWMFGIISAVTIALIMIWLGANR